MKHPLYPNLFSKGYVGNLEVKNRIIRNSMGTHLANYHCTVSDYNVKAAAEAADGGVGIVFMDNVVANNMHHMGLSAEDDTMLPGLALMAEAIREHGAIPALQIAHAGRDNGFVSGSDIVSASRITFEPWYEAGAKLPREMTVEEIHELEDLYGKAALRAKNAGFQLVEIHGACGCLPTNFLSPHDNHRTDMYGGSLHNRMRFLVELVRSIKRYVGPNFPVSVKLSMDDCEPEGIRLEETIEVCKVLEREGVALLNLVTATHATANHSSGFYPWAYCAEMSAKVKEVVNVPVMVTGAIQSPECAEEILAKGQADFIGTARQVLADPAWPKKAKACHSEDIIPCIRCMIGCTDRGILGNQPIRCAVNPTLFKFYQEKYPKTEEPKRVAVIGAGPGGCEAALTAKKRGHDVTLYEKRSIGGAMIEASVPDYKADIRRLTKYYEVQIEKAGIPVKYEEATAEKLIAENYDAVIIAVGGATRKLCVPGIDNEIVAYAMDYLGGRVKFEGDKAVVIGGGITGAEAALELAAEGKQVTIVEVMDQFLPSRATVIPEYLMALGRNNVRIVTGNRLESVKDHTAVIVDRFGNTEEIPTDAIVIAAGFTPQKELANKLEEETNMEVYTVGDCRGARQIQDAVHEGYAAGRQV